MVAVTVTAPGSIASVVRKSADDENRATTDPAWLHQLEVESIGSRLRGGFTGGFLSGHGYINQCKG
jgi:hypothetical protein